MPNKKWSSRPPTFLGHFWPMKRLRTSADAAHISIRSSKGAQVFGALGPRLLRCSYAWKEVKRMIFESMIIPTMLDGVECCVVTVGMMEETTTVFHRLVRSALHISLHHTHKGNISSPQKNCFSPFFLGRTRFRFHGSLIFLATLALLTGMGPEPGPGVTFLPSRPQSPTHHDVFLTCASK
jgi:hypothetical protein